MDKSQKQEYDNYLISIINKPFHKSEMREDYDNGIISLTDIQLYHLERREKIKFHKHNQYRLFCELNHELIIKNIIEPTEDMKKKFRKDMHPYSVVSWNLYAKTNTAKACRTLAGINKLTVEI